MKKHTFRKDKKGNYLQPLQLEHEAILREYTSEPDYFTHPKLGIVEGFNDIDDFNNAVKAWDKGEAGEISPEGIASLMTIEFMLDTEAEEGGES